jgi:hypothetical protein
MVGCTDHGPTLDMRGCDRIFDEQEVHAWGCDHFSVVADLAAQMSSGRRCSNPPMFMLLFTRV